MDLEVVQADLDLKEQQPNNDQQQTASVIEGEKKVRVLACLEDEEIIAPVQMTLTQPEAGQMISQA